LKALGALALASGETQDKLSFPGGAMRRFLSLLPASLFAFAIGCSAPNNFPSRSQNEWQAIMEQNGQKRLLQKISITTSAAVTTLATKTLDDSAQGSPVGVGHTLMFQSDQDFWYELRQAGATTAVTNYSGARPGVFVSLKQQEFVVAGTDSAVVDLKADSASGTVAVFLVN
jgi:hypothetical protein